MAAIGAVGREPLRGEGEFEEIGVGVGADPSLVGKLEISFHNIGKEGSEFEGANLEINAHAAPLILEGGADQAGLLVG